MRAKTHRSSLGLGGERKGEGGPHRWGDGDGDARVQCRASKGERDPRCCHRVMGYRTFVSKVIIEGNYYLHCDEAEVRGKGKVRSVLWPRTLFPLFPIRLTHPAGPRSPDSSMPSASFCLLNLRLLPPHLRLLGNLDYCCYCFFFPFTFAFALPAPLSFLRRPRWAPAAILLRH